MKLIVETIGPFQVFAPAPEQFARHDRPSVVTQSRLMEAKAAAGILKVLAQVNDDANDASLVEVLIDCDDVELAVQAYAAEFPVEVEDTSVADAVVKEAAKSSKAADEKSKATNAK